VRRLSTSVQLRKLTLVRLLFASFTRLYFFESTVARAKLFLDCSLVQAIIRPPPPVQVFGVEGRYATALYSAASKSGKLEAVEKEMNILRDQLAKDVHLREFCVNPSLQRATKVVEFAKVLDKLKITTLTKNMF
ncbi:F-type H+-transporting ATPase subunit O, partial [Paragonimus westermani]